MDSDNSSPKSIIQSVLRFLAIRIRSKAELLAYVDQKTRSQETVDMVMNYLEAHRLIDDEAFTKAWITARLHKGKGDLLMKRELHLKGISKVLIQNVLESVDRDEWYQAISGIIEKTRNKWEKLPPYQQKSKMYQILAMRGFSGTYIDAFMAGRLK